MTGLITDNPHEEPASTGPRPAASGRLPGAAILALLLLILAVAAWFRFDGITWDGGTHLHPDERFLTIVGSKLSVPDNPLDYLRTSRSTLNPYNFGEGFYVYGNFPMTVTRFAAEWSAGLCDAVAARAGQPWCAYAFTGYDGIHLVGRFLSALVDLISIVFTFLIGRRLYGQWAGLIAAALLALAVMPIQQSHFFTMDNWAAAFTTAAIYFAVRAASLGDAEPRWRLHWWALFGLALGLAVSARINMAPLALVINISAIIWLARRRHWLDFQEPAGSGRWYDFARNDIWRALTGIALAAVVSVLTFRLAQPYAFMDAAMVRVTSSTAMMTAIASATVAISRNRKRNIGGPLP